MTNDIAINGYGRIGPNVPCAFMKAGRVHDIEIVAINDLGDAETNARLMRYDTAHERCAGSVAVDDDQLRSADACRRGASASVVARGPPTFLAAAAPCPTARWSRAGDVAQSQRRDIRTQIGLGAIAGVHQDHTARKAGLTRPAQLLGRDLRLCLEADLFRHTRLAPTFVIFSPVLRQIQPIGHRQACMVIGNQQRHRVVTFGRAVASCATFGLFENFDHLRKVHVFAQTETLPKFHWWPKSIKPS